MIRIIELIRPKFEVFRGLGLGLGQSSEVSRGGGGARQGTMEAEKENSGIDGLKQILVETLESQGKLDAIKAEVRATVFGALNTKLVDTRVAKRKTNTKVSRLLRSEEGTRALEGVIDLLR